MNHIIKSTSFAFPSSQGPKPPRFTYNSHEFVIVKKLFELKYPAYLAFDNKTNQFFVIKASQRKETPVISLQKVHLSHLTMGPTDCCQQPPKSLSLFDIIMTKNIRLDDISSRTYFRQIICGIEEIHSQGGAHLDLKLSSLVLNENFMVKVVSSHKRSQGRVDKECRASEVVRGSCKNPQAADIYSLGIILFLFKTGGFLPFDEEKIDTKGNMSKFWQSQCKRLNKKPVFFSFDFRKLFMKMTDLNPDNRPSLEEIKASVWYSKKTHSTEELFVCMKKKVEG